MCSRRGSFNSAVRLQVMALAIASCNAEAQPPLPVPARPSPAAVASASTETIANGPWNVARYDACLDALGAHLSHSPYLDEVRRSAIDKKHLPYDSWNINLPHKQGAINLLVPDGGLTALPAICGTAPAFPTCWSHPRAGDVICTPEMGKHLAAPEQTPPSDIHVMVAFRFLFFMTLGHELGHLELDPLLDTASAYPKPVTGNLSCFRLPQDRSTIESRCDEVGIRLGCSWLLKSDFATPLVVGDPREDLKLLVALHALEGIYHKGDELCRGDPRYASITSRIERFGTGIVECFNPKRDSVLFELARQSTNAYTAADDSLRKRQLAGWPATSLYGRTRIRSQRVKGAQHGPLFFTWFETSVASAFQIVRAVDGQIGEFSSPLAAWKPAARLVSVVATPNGWRAVVDATPTPGQRQLETFEIQCSTDRPDQCVTAKVQDLAWHGSGALISAGAGFVVANDDRIQIYPTPEALTRGSSTGGQGGFFVGHRFELITPLADGGVLGMTVRSDGLFMADVFAGGKQRVVSLPFPKKGNLRISALHIDLHHVLVLFQQRDLVEWSAYALWDCPPALFTAKHGAKLECHAYEVPSMMKYPLVAATETEDAMEASRIEPLPDVTERYALSADGWTWLIDLTTIQGLLVPAQGVARVEDGRIYTYRAGRLDAIRADWQAITQRNEHLTAE
jgi:hypothetical protein